MTQIDTTQNQSSTNGEAAQEWSEQIVDLEGRSYRCRVRTVGRLLEVSAPGVHRVAPRGIVRLDVAVKSTLRQALRKAA